MTTHYGAGPTATGWTAVAGKTEIEEGPDLTCADVPNRAKVVQSAVRSRGPAGRFRGRRRRARIPATPLELSIEKSSSMRAS